MSDPVTNIDIEDVLSSIRRLVAQGDSVPAASAPVASQPAPPAPDKLVLTPALRVDAPGSATGQAGQTGPDPRDEAQGPQVEPETTAREDPAQGPVAPAPTDVPADAGRRRLEETIAALEAAVAGDGGSWDPDGSETTPVMDWSAANAMDRTLFAARAMAEPPSATEVDPEDESAEPDDNAARDGATLIDEDTLRDLIADVVREELQGALGERITRNVRKLVRREVYRMLSSQDFQ